MDANASREPEWQLLPYAESSWAKHALLADVKGVNAVSLLNFLQWPAESSLTGFVKAAYHTSQILGEATTDANAFSMRNRAVGRVIPTSDELHGIGWFHLWAMYGLRSLFVAARGVNDNARTPKNVPRFASQSCIDICR